MQHEQTEIDALATLRPNDLRRIALAAIEPFYDSTIERQVEEARRKWLDEANQKLREHPEYDGVVAELETALEAVQDAVDELESIKESAERSLEDVEVPEFERPELEITVEAPEPLFTTEDDFTTATLKLIERRHLVGVNLE